MSSKRGFTLIELVMIIVILAILAAVAIPKYVDLVDQAKESAERGVVGGVRGGIMTYYAEQVVKDQPPTNPWPPDLDGLTGYVDFNSTQAFFNNVLAQGGITDGSWSKDNDVGGYDYYRGPYGQGWYKYDSSNGSFLFVTTYP